MADNYISAEQQMSENGRSSDSPVKYYKKKSRGKKRKTLCYVDYDQATGEEDVVQSAAALTWPGTASSVQMESSVCAMHCARESVTYDDEDDSLSAADPRIIRGRFYNNQFAVNHNNPTNWMHTTASRPPNLCVFPNAHQVSSSCSSEILSVVDPTVVASEKQDIFKKPVTQQVNTAAKQRQPLTAKKLRRIQQKRHYRELQKKQEEQAKEHASTPRPLRPCKYYQSGNCNKGKNCTFSHSCEIIRKPELCKFYLLSTCTKGLACPYYHGDWPCKFFHVFKFCMNGDACKFSHEPLTDESRQLLDKAVANGDTSATGKTGQQLAGVVAKENRFSNGKTRQPVNYGTPLMPQCMTSSQPVGICHPHLLANGCQLPSNSAAVSMTLQQKIYRLNVIEFEKPVISELPAYVDVNDPQWSADPRVRPCIQRADTTVGEHMTTNGSGVVFYRSGGDGSGADNGCVVQQCSVSDAGSGTSSEGSVVCSRVAAVHSNSSPSCSPVKSSPENSVCSVNSSITCESSPNLPHKPENFAVAVVKAEPDDALDTASVPTARHMFQHNISWLNVARSSGVQKLSQPKN